MQGKLKTEIVNLYEVETKSILTFWFLLVKTNNNFIGFCWSNVAKRRSCLHHFQCPVELILQSQRTFRFDAKQLAMPRSDRHLILSFIRDVCVLDAGVSVSLSAFAFKNSSNMCAFEESTRFYEFIHASPNQNCYSDSSAHNFKFNDSCLPSKWPTHITTHSRIRFAATVCFPFHFQTGQFDIDVKWHPKIEYKIDFVSTFDVLTEKRKRKKQQTHKKRMICGGYILFSVRDETKLAACSKAKTESAQNFSIELEKHLKSAFQTQISSRLLFLEDARARSNSHTHKKKKNYLIEIETGVWMRALRISLRLIFLSGRRVIGTIIFPSISLKSKFERQTMDGLGAGERERLGVCATLWRRRRHSTVCNSLPSKATKRNFSRVLHGTKEYWKVFAGLTTHSESGRKSEWARVHRANGKRDKQKKNK